MYRLINDVLLGDSKFNNVGMILFCDAAFTSLKLFRKLDSRGIAAVGPINAQKPSQNPTANSWPHQKFKSGDKSYLQRGWDRVAYQKMPSGNWLQATVWRDNKFVKMLSSCYVTNGVERVTRWMRAAGKYMSVPARLVLRMYQHHMGHVDRVDKNVALSGVRMKRCRKRYHRALFFWYVAAVGINNVLVLFIMLFPAAEEIKKREDANDFGWKHWFQDELAVALISQGLQMATSQLHNEHARVIQKTYRQWKARGRIMHDRRDQQQSAHVSRQPRGRGRGRGRPRKRRAGGRPKSTTATKQTPLSKRARGLEAIRVQSMNFAKLPAFVPGKCGSTRIPRLNPVSLLVDQKVHTLVHANKLKDKLRKKLRHDSRKNTRVEDQLAKLEGKTTQGRCVSCYAAAPALSRDIRRNNPSKRRTHMSDGTPIPRPFTVCDVCLVHLCEDCHKNVWPPHIQKIGTRMGGIRPKSIVYI